MENKEYLVDLITEYLFKSNDEYGFRHLAKVDAINIMEIIRRNYDTKQQRSKD